MTPKEYIFQWLKEKYPDWKTDSIKEILEGFDYQAETTSSSEHRWWTNHERVLKLGDKYIGYDWATTTGDQNAFDKGFEFDEDSLCFMEPYEKTIIAYRKVKP